MSSSLGGRLRKFSLDEMKVATNNFDKTKLLGAGGEGQVYKGLIKVGDGETRSDVIVAIKCLKSKSDHEDHRLKNEIELTSRLHHGNLVSLKGYCQEYPHRILVYEYMPNGSLAGNIYPNCSLSWMLLLKICIDAARGLEYLHHGISAEEKIIHRDVKPGNILLDDNWVAKISDFGLSKKGIGNQQESEAIRTRVKGTIGYFAPEYVYNEEVTRKTDVYAFGVVLLEVLCRKRRRWPLYDDSTDSEEDDIGWWARQNIVTNLKVQILQTCLDVFIDIARRCLLRNPQDRPSMMEVVSKLQNALQLQHQNETAKPRYSFPEEATNPLLARPLDDFSMSTHKRMIVRPTTSASSSTSQDTTPSSGYKEEEELEPRSEEATKLSLESDSSLSTSTEEYILPRAFTGQVVKPSSEEATKLSFLSSLESDSSLSTSTEEYILPWAFTGQVASTSSLDIDDGIVLYYSSYGSMSIAVEQSAEDSLLVRVILKELFRVNVDERDVSKYDAYSPEHLQQVDNDLCLPHLFVRGKCIGGVDVLVQLYQSAKLASLLGGSPITLVCDNCRGDMTCTSCVWTRNFLVCKDCNALTMVLREEDRKLRYCPECQVNQLFLRTLILRSEGFVFLEGSSLSCVQHSSDLDPWWEYVRYVFQGSSLPSRDRHSKLAIAIIILIVALYLLPRTDLSLVSVDNPSLVPVLKPFIDGLNFLSALAGML